MKKKTDRSRVIDVPINKIVPNPHNPCVLRDDKFHKLKKSLSDFPEMLDKRPIVAVTQEDGRYMVLGGNMRLRAMKDMGLKEAPIMLADEWTEEQRREFVIKDNLSFGEWDTEQLVNEWDVEAISQWGVDVPVKDRSAGTIEEVELRPYTKAHVLISYEAIHAAEVRNAIEVLIPLGVQIVQSSN